MKIINEVKVYNLERSIVLQSIMLQNNILAPVDIVNKRVQVLEQWVKSYPNNEINTDLSVVLTNNHTDNRYLSGILVNAYVLISNKNKYILDGIGETIIDIAQNYNSYDLNIFTDCPKENKRYEFYRTAYDVIMQKKAEVIADGVSNPMVSLVMTYNKCGEPLTYKTVLTDKANTLISNGEVYLYENEVKDLIGKSLVNDYKVYYKINTNYYNLMNKYNKFKKDVDGLNVWERDIEKLDFINFVEQLPLFALLVKNYDEVCD